MPATTQLEEHMLDMESYDDFTEFMPEYEEEGLVGRGEEAAVRPLPIPRLPIFLFASGRYESFGPILRPPIIPRVPERQPLPIPRPLPASEVVPMETLEAELEEEAEAAMPILFPFASETLFLDVDGRYPQMTASGTLRSGLRTRIHWIAKLVRRGRSQWYGRIWYKDGDVRAFPFTHVTISVANSLYPAQRRATVSYSTFGRAPRRGRTFRFRSRTFRSVNFEFDRAAGTSPVLWVDTHDHPDRPATLPPERLTVQRVFERAGFRVSTSPAGTVPLALAGNNKWSDMEMHDAMQVYWSRFANRPQWAMWVFLAGLHEMGTSLGGIMFDDIGPNHRQGTAIFMDSFIDNAPAGDADPAAWVRRMKFWTTCHEMGHAFNLAHSWQKELGVPWISSLHNEPEARSFMNYPYRVSGGVTAFFRDFEYRFSNQELLFMRHAPERLVQMGAADWFDHHGFEQAEVMAEPTFEAELRVHREHRIFEFLEPVAIELKMKNVSPDPRLVSEHLIEDLDKVTLIIKKRGKPARQFIPFAQHCYRESAVVVQPEHAVYDSVLISAGRNGWDIAEPGDYTIQAAVRIGDEDVISNVLTIRVAPPQGVDDELVAQDFFSDEVGRILYFNGSNVLDSGIRALRNAIDRLPNHLASIHARVVLANTKARPWKVLQIQENGGVLKPAHELDGAFRATKPDKKKVRSWMSDVLIEDLQRSADTLGHIKLNAMALEFADWLDEQGDPADAVSLTDQVHDVLEKRGVLDSVLSEMKTRGDKYRLKGK